MSVINDLYIDEIRIITDSDSSRFSTGVKNILHADNGVTGGALPIGTVTTTGLKWVVQVTNGSGVSYNPSVSGGIVLNVCTNTANVESYDQIFTYAESTTILDNASIFFGWSDNGATIVSNNVTYSSSNNINDPTTQQIYLADQALGGTQAVGARFRLYKNGTEIERVGVRYTTDDGWENGGAQAVTAIPFLIQGTTALGSLSGVGAVATGSYTRDIPANLSQNAPTLDDHTDDWSVSTDNRFDASAAGDPHITTLNGERYKFVHVGPFRLFQDVIDGKLLIINGCSENGPTRWSMNEYIKKFFIQYGDKNILIDNGFRGQEASILENNGIEYTEKKLPFHKTAKRYSHGLNGVRHYSTTDSDKPDTEDLPAFKRNQLEFQIKTDDGKSILNIIVQNVNEFNLQPCRLGINLGDIPISKNARGCIVSKQFAHVCKFDDIKSVNPLPALTEEFVANLPEDEVQPCTVNAQWV